MKLGFALKKTKKTGLLAAPAGADSGHISRAFDAAPAKKNEAAERVYVTDFDPNAVAPGVDDGARKATLVIPLLKENEWKAQVTAAVAEISDEAESEPTVDTEKKEKVDDGEQLTEDEIAARQLLADAKAQQNGNDSNERKVNNSLVIPIKNRTQESDPLAEKRAKLFNLDTDKHAPKSVPILQQNVVPGMDELEDVTEKYRHDVALRPDALDVHSDAYESVPIADFGAAMLRGMGWKGQVEDEKQDADDPKPRQKLLGLGATAKPKVAGDTGKNGHHKGTRRTEDKTRTNGLNQREDGKTSSRNDKRRDDEPSRNGRDRADRGKDSSRDRSRSRERNSRKERDRSSKTSDRDGGDRRRDRSRDDDRERDRGSDRGRDRERNRDDRGRDRREDRDSRDDREKRKRSRSYERPSERKKSSSRR